MTPKSNVCMLSALEFHPAHEITASKRLHLLFLSTFSVSTAFRIWDLVQQHVLVSSVFILNHFFLYFAHLAARAALLRRMALGE